MAITSRVIAASLGKVPKTLVLRWISAFKRARGWVRWVCSQCTLGNFKYDSTALSAPSSKRRASRPHGVAVSGWGMTWLASSPD